MVHSAEDEDAVDVSLFFEEWNCSKLTAAFDIVFSFEDVAKPSVFHLVTERKCLSIKSLDFNTITHMLLLQVRRYASKSIEKPVVDGQHVV